MRGIKPAMAEPLDIATQRLQRLLGLSADAARKAVEETTDCLNETLDEFIQKRHRQLQAQGHSNQQIYQRLATEIETLRFRAPPLSARQIRRRIYG